VLRAELKLFLLEQEIMPGFQNIVVV